MKNRCLLETICSAVVRTPRPAHRGAVGRHHRSAGFPIAACVGVLFGGPVLAQEIEEIVVSAQKREQSLQEVGISVTAYTDTQVRELGFVNTVDVVAMTPNLSYTIPNAESSQINFFLRGVGLNDFADAQENPVAVYVDEVYKPAMGGLHLQMFDMERIEVLRGPQGTLFGRNSTGGVIHYLTKRPSQDFDAYIDASFGEFEHVKVEAAIGGPFIISNPYTIMGRLSLAINQHDGWTDNRTAGIQDYNGADSVAGRAQLLFAPSDSGSVLLNVQYSENDAEVGAWQHESTMPSADGNTSLPLPENVDFWGAAGPGFGGLGADLFGYQDRDGDPWSGDYDRNGSVKVKHTGGALNIDWKFGNLLFTSITAFSNVDRLQEEDTEMNPALAGTGLPGLIAPTFQAETDTITQELRLASDSDQRFRWLGGFFYFDNDVIAHYDLDTTPIDFVLLDADYTQETNSWALFGQFEYDFSDSWTLIAGLRYTNEEKTMHFVNIDRSSIPLYGGASAIGFCSTLPPGALPNPAIGCFNPAPTPLSSSRPTVDHGVLFTESSVGSLAVLDTDMWTGKLELDWKVNDDLLLYGSYSRGQKSPGFNSGFIDVTLVFANNPVATIPFDEETLNAFEVGVKSTIVGGTTRLNASIFYYDYEDFQTFRFEFLNQIIFNTDAEVYGGEIEITNSPNEHWDLQLGLGYLDATAKDIPTLTAGTPPFSPSELRDRDMVGAPELSLNALVRYNWQALGGTWAVQAWGNYAEQIWYDIQNHPISEEDGYSVVNFRGSYTSGDGSWQIYSYVNNAFEEEYKTYTFDFTGTFGFNQQAAGLPRWWGAGFRYNWGGGN